MPVDLRRSLSTRGLIARRLGMPAIIRTPGLLMPISVPKPDDLWSDSKDPLTIIRDAFERVLEPYVRQGRSGEVVGQPRSTYTVEQRIEIPMCKIYHETYGEVHECGAIDVESDSSGGSRGFELLGYNPTPLDKPDSEKPETLERRPVLNATWHIYPKPEFASWYLDPDEIHVCGASDVKFGPKFSDFVWALSKFRAADES
jgi:hypothetical protein